MTTGINDLGRQGNVSGNHQIAGCQPFHYFIVRHVESRLYLQKRDPVEWRYRHCVIGYQRQRHLRPSRCLEQNLFNDAGAGVSINPYFHCLHCT